MQGGGARPTCRSSLDKGRHKGATASRVEHGMRVLPSGVEDVTGSQHLRLVEAALRENQTQVFISRELGKQTERHWKNAVCSENLEIKAVKVTACSFWQPLLEQQELQQHGQFVYTCDLQVSLDCLHQQKAPAVFYESLYDARRYHILYLY